MPYILINEVNFYYELFGDGKIPIVFIPGYRCDHNVWSEVARVFTPTHRILLFDNQASGKTKDNHNPITVWSMAENIMALIDKLGLKQVIIVGYAMGGNIAQAIAILFPDKVRQLFLLSTVFKWSEYACDFVGQLYSNKVAGNTDVVNTLLYKVCFATKYKVEHSLEEFQELCNGRSPVQNAADEKRQIKALKQFNSSKLLRKIKAPTIVISPEEERLATVDEGKLLADKIGPNAEQVLIQNAGHAPLLEQPQKVVDIMKRFI